MDTIVSANALAFKRMIEKVIINNIELPGNVTIIKEEKDQKAYLDSGIGFYYGNSKIIFLAHWEKNNHEIMYLELENPPDSWRLNYGIFEKMK